MKIIKSERCMVAILLLLVAIFAYFIQIATVYGEGGNERKLVENKLKLVDYILTQSDVVKMAESSGNQQDETLIQQAKQDFLQARMLLKEDKTEQANVMLTGLLQSLATLPAVQKEKQVASENAQVLKYKELVVTISTLMESMQTELDQLGDGQFSTVKLENILATAETLAKEARYQQANNLLSEVYYNLKLFIKQQRDNKTLVYSLDFKSVEDEYEYELKRYKSFSMLMDMYVKKQAVSQETVALAEQYLLKAGEAKLEASILAGKKQFTEAIKTMEQANQFYILALRTVGLMIP